jgi:hypothetical protein
MHPCPIFPNLGDNYLKLFPIMFLEAKNEAKSDIGWNIVGG